MRDMHLFSGAGGGILSSLILGHEPVIAVEWDSYCCQVLRERVADGWFPNMRVHEGDVRLFDPSEYKGRVDCIHAGFPCQDISNAGNKAGVGEGARSGLYREVLRISDEVRPEYIFLENVAAIVTGASGEWLRTIIGDLAERGFDAVWCCLAASQIGAKHKRNRWWLLGYPSSEGLSDRRQSRRQKSETETRTGVGSRPERPDSAATNTNSESAERNERQTKSSLGRVADDVAYRVDVHDWVQEEAQVGRTTTETENRANRLKALKNGQVPLQAATAFSILWKMMEEVSNEKIR